MNTTVDHERCIVPVAQSGQPMALPTVDSFFPQPAFRPGAPLCFLHISKTAGTSVRLMIENAFDGDRVFPSGSRAYNGGYVNVDQSDSALDDFDSFSLASGHQGALILNRMPADTNSFLWFRDPFDRLMSHFFFSVVQKAGHATNEFARRAEAEPLGPVFVDWLRTVPEGYSFHAGQIAGVQLSGFSDWRQSNPDLSLHEQALAVVERSFFVGMLEDYDRALDYFSALTGILPPGQTIRRNVGRKRHLQLSLTSEQEAEMWRRLAPDIEFYGILRQIYLRQMESIASRIEAEPLLGLVGKRDELRSALSRKQRPSRSLETAAWLAWDAVLGENLDGREQTLVNGTVLRWRWTGPTDQSIFYFKLDGQRDLQLDIDLYAATPRENAAAARLWVNDSEVAMALVEGNPHGLRLRGIVPRAAITAPGQLQEFRLVTPVMVDEAVLVPVSSRKLGLAIQRISAHPLESVWRRRLRRITKRLLGS